MRASAQDPMVGVSCGHVVPRVKPPGRERLPGYWCDECGTYRMSGGKATGENGHAYLLMLPELVAENLTPIVVDDPGTPDKRALVAALGAQIRSVR